MGGTNNKMEAGMSGKRFTVCCTDKGTHGRVEFAPVVFDDGAVREVLVRTGKNPAPQAVYVDPDDGKTYTAGRRAVLPVASHRTTHEGAERWRWECPRCRRDVVLNGVNMRRALAGLGAAGVAVLDISMLPAH